MKFLIQLSLGIGLIFLICENLHAQTLTVGVTPWAPWRIVGEKKVSGIVIEIIREIQSREDIEIEFKVLPPMRMRSYFRENIIDVEPGASPLWRTDDKDISVYTIPFYETGDIVLMRRDNAINAGSPRDFKGMTLGAGLGYFYPEGFQEAFYSSARQVYKSTADRGDDR